MRVLIACEYSGRVRDAFIAQGHKAMSCDFLPTEVDGPHYQGDIRDVLYVGTMDLPWDLMVAHPPCTYLAASGMHWTKRGLRDPKLTEDALDFVRFLMDAPIPRIAVENPVGVISSRIRKPNQIIQPYMFGEDASKATCLWLKGLPLLRPTKFVEPRMICCDDMGDKVARRRWGNQCDNGQNKLAPSPDRWKERSRTYAGIASAMADQWGESS